MRAIKAVLYAILLICLSIVAYTNVSLHKNLHVLTDRVQEIEKELAKPTLVDHTQQEHVVIFLVKSTPTDFHLVPVNRQIGGPVNPKIALQTLLNGPLANEELVESVPHTTKLLGLSIYDGLATANFSSELRDDFNGGSLIESYLVQAIVSTLTEFPEIEEVQILIDGEKVESIGGHIYIAHPLRREAN